jgi:hypothetical protein
LSPGHVPPEHQGALTPPRPSTPAQRQLLPHATAVEQELALTGLLSVSADTLDDLLDDPALRVLHRSPEEASAARILSGALRPVRADELAAAILVDHPRADPWKATRILAAVLDARHARHRPTMRQIVDDLAAAGDHVSLGLVETTVARARAVGLRTEGCEPYRTPEGRPRRRRCAYRAVHWTPATLAVTADRQVRAAVLLAARLLRDQGAQAVRAVVRALRRGAGALLDLWRRLRGDLLPIAPNSVNAVSRVDPEDPPNTEVPRRPSLGASNVNVVGLADQRSSSPEEEPGGVEPAHPARSRPRRPSRHSRLLGELLGERAARVHEGNVPWTAAHLLRIAVTEGWPDPLRAAFDAYDTGVSTVLSDGAERERSSHPIRHPARWAAAVARRILQRAEPPAWPERRPSVPAMPPASPVPRPRRPLVSARRDAESGPEAQPGLAAMSAAEEEAAWEALGADERERAEAAARRKYPDLAEHTHERGHIWRLTVLDAARGRPAGQGDGDG